MDVMIAFISKGIAGGIVMVNRELFNDMERGELTDRAYEELCHGTIWDGDEFDSEDLQSVVDLGDRSDFVEGVARRLEQLGVDCAKDDTEVILAEVKRRYKERIGDNCPRTIQEWLRGTLPGVTNRVNNYNLCYALEMNIKETAEFFYKYYLTAPFYYKDKVDAIFFYCLHRQKPYLVIKKMLEEANGFEVAEQSGTKTLEIGRRIWEIEDDDAFMRYLSAHCYNNEQQYQAAREKIIALMDKHGKGNYAKLHFEVMGFSYQETKRNHEERQRILPDEFLKSLPTDRTFLDIKNGKRETYETLRKALVILYFYDFYMKAQESDKDWDEKTIRNNLLDFYEEMNQQLLDCGLSGLYERHPFDKLILRCAASNDPIVTFYGLNGMRYGS